MAPELWHLPHGHIGHTVEVYDEIDSTNRRAAELASDQQHHGWAVLAESQTAGRGQYGRVWQCPRGSGVLLSVLTFPPSELRRAVIQTALAAVAVGETILEVTGLQAGIKWPNDVLIRGRKVCGILIEQTSGIVAGMGLNINQTAEDFAQLDLPDAGSLRTASGCTFDRDEVARVLLRHLDAEYDRLLQGELTTLEACWKWRVGLLGRHVRAELFDGTFLIGRLRELGFDGVDLETSEGRRVVRPEWVRHLRQVE